VPPFGIFQTLTEEKWTNVTFLRKVVNTKHAWTGVADVLSRESPLHSSSSIFLVMILVTSCRSSFSLSRPDDAALAVRVSRYSLAVFDINVSEKHDIRMKNNRKKRKADQNQRMRMVSGRSPPLGHRCWQTLWKVHLSMRMRAFVGTTCLQW